MTRRSFVQTLIAFFVALGARREAVEALISDIRNPEPLQPKYIDPHSIEGMMMRDVERIRGHIAASLARRSPYIELLDLPAFPIGMTAVTVLRPS